MAQLVCPSVVGRDTELAQLERYLEEAREGRGRLVVLSGEAGIGKTRLARELASRARASGIRVRSGRAVQAAAPVPYRPVIEAVQGLLVEDRVIGDPALDAYREALSRLFGDAAAGDPVEAGSPLAVMEGLLRMVRLIADQRGLVLIFEDLHWADADTLAVVEYFADHVDSIPSLCVCTERTDTSAWASELITGLAARRAIERIELLPLADEAVEEVARLTLGTEEVPTVLVSALRNRAAGVPFLIEEMLSAYLVAGGPQERRPEWWISRRIAEALPPSYRDVVRGRLATLDAGTRQVVEAAAVLGRAFDWHLLMAIAGIDEPEVLDCLRDAVRARVIAPTSGLAPAFEFRHALAREAVLAELLPPERAALSAEAARAIEAAHPGLPGEWCLRVADLWEDAGEPLPALGALQEAARRAIAHSAFASAEQMLIRARALAGDDLMAWMGVDDLLLDALAAAGKPERVRELGTSLIDVYGNRYKLHDERIARLHLKVARGLAPAGAWDAVEAHLDQARKHAGRSGDRTLRVGIDALAARAALAVGAPARALAFAAAAKHAAESSASSDALCEALDAEARAALANGQLEQGAALFTRCMETAAGARLPLWQARVLLELGAIDELTSGELGRLHAARSLAATIGAVSLHAGADLRLSWAYLGLGELDAAEAALERCLEASRLHRLEFLGEALSAACMLHALRDEPSKLDATAVKVLSEAGSAVGEAAVSGNGHAVLALVQGDENAALVHLEAAAKVPPGGTEWSRLWLHGLRSLLRAAAGNVAAIEEAEEVASHDPRVRAYVGYARSIAHGRAGSPDRAMDAFTAAEESMPAGWRREHAKLVVARCAFVDGWGEPKRWMREALTFLDCASLSHFSAACKALLRRAGVPVPRRGRGESPVPEALQVVGVTSREMDVLNLVAERLGNKEIGERLYLSPRTVEGHVANLIRKLGLGSRSDLVATGQRFAAEVASGAELS